MALTSSTLLLSRDLQKDEPMKPRNDTLSAFSPFFMWSDLAVKTGEMMMASGQVITHRMGRLQKAKFPLSARDQREFTLMGQEKIEAAAESAQSMAQQLWSTHQRLGLDAFNGLMGASNAVLSLMSSQTVGQAVQRQAEVVKAMTKAATESSQLSHEAAKVAHHALVPLHSRATANARRLVKR